VRRDLSAASEAAIENQTCLNCLGRIGVEEIHLVTVVPSNVHAGMPGIDFENRRRRAMDRYRNVIEGAGFEVDIHVVRGTPHRRINGIAETIDADLVLIGSRGESPLENRIIGSTARNLARTAVVPLLVNRIERETDDPDVVSAHLFRRMMYATDFSTNAERAFETFSYHRHAPRRRRSSTFERRRIPIPARWIQPNGSGNSPISSSSGGSVHGSTFAGVIRRGRSSIRRPNTSRRRCWWDRGGHSRLRRLLLGSVSERLVARASGNVLLVPPPKVQ